MAEAGTGVADAPRNPGVADDDTRPRRKRKCGTRFGGDGSRGGGSRIGGDGGMHGGIGCSGDGGVGGTGVATPLGTGVADSARRLGRHAV